jgi:hypothetical protein
MATSRTNRIVAIIAAVAAASLASAAEVGRADGFAEGQRLAAGVGVPHLVLVHGAPWQPLGTRLLDVIWNSDALAGSLEQPAILTAIAIPHDPGEEEIRTFNQLHLGWNPKSYSTLPALQLHAADGHLLLVRQGRALRELATPGEFAAFANQVLADAATRRELLAALDAAEAENDQAPAHGLLDRLLALPFTPDPGTLERLTRLDPDDRLGWQARPGVQPWDTHLREITARIRDGKAAEVIEEMDRRLVAGSATPPQQTLLLGGKGMALASLDRLTDAWQCFQDAHAAAPNDPLARALHRHGIRIAGLPLRETLPDDSTLRGREVGRNLTRDHATFTLSSASSDNPADHASLFRGQHAAAGFAFHTDAESDAHIVIDLHGDCRLRALRIVNRSTLHQRAETLTLWTSGDGKSWQRQWRAEAPAPAWEVVLDPPVPARFLKLGLDRDTPEHLHLRAVDAYGERP